MISILGRTYVFDGLDYVEYVIAMENGLIGLIPYTGQAGAFEYCQFDCDLKGVRFEYVDDTLTAEDIYSESKRWKGSIKRFSEQLKIETASNLLHLRIA